MGGRQFGLGGKSRGIVGGSRTRLLGARHGHFSRLRFSTGIVNIAPADQS